MGRNEVITSMSDKSGLSKTDCEKALDAFAESISDFLADGEKILLKGFMSFEIKERAERKGRNPKTGEVSTFPAAKTVKCKISKAIKDIVDAS